MTLFYLVKKVVAESSYKVTDWWFTTWVSYADELCSSRNVRIVVLALLYETLMHFKVVKKVNCKPNNYTKINRCYNNYFKSRVVIHKYTKEYSLISHIRVLWWLFLRFIHPFPKDAAHGTQSVESQMVFVTGRMTVKVPKGFPSSCFHFHFLFSCLITCEGLSPYLHPTSFQIFLIQANYTLEVLTIIPSAFWQP